MPPLASPVSSRALAAIGDCAVRIATSMPSRVSLVLLFVFLLLLPAESAVSSTGLDSLRGLAEFRFDVWPLRGQEHGLTEDEIETIVFEVFAKEGIVPVKSAHGAKLQLGGGAAKVELSAYEEGFIYRLDLLMLQPAVLLRKLDAGDASLFVTWRKTFDWGFARDQKQLRDEMREATRRMALSFVEDWLEAHPTTEVGPPSRDGS